jgi:broad specificity phosphatase PhoE
MTKLIFITHPDVIIDKDIPIDKWKLSPDGLETVERLSSESFWSEVEIIYSSSEPKASTVAEIIALKSHVPLAKEYKKECLCEVLHRTFIEPDLYAVAVEKWYLDPTGHPQGWESVNEAQKRIVACVSEIMLQNRDKTVVIVGHGGTGTLLKCFIKGVSPSYQEDPQQTGKYLICNWGEKEVITEWIKY